MIRQLIVAVKRRSKKPTFPKRPPSATAKKSRRSVRKTRQVALVTIQAAPTGTISIFSPPLPSSSIHLNKKSNLSFKYSTVPFAWER